MVILGNRQVSIFLFVLLFLSPIFVFAQECQKSEINLINGSFEFPMVTSDDRWDIFANGTEDLAWNVEWRDTGRVEGRPEDANIELQRGVGLWSAYEGSQYTELDSDWNGSSASTSYESEPSSINIYQDIETVSGASYELKFSFSAHPLTSWENNILQIFWGDTLVDVVSASGTGMTSWNSYEYVLEAHSDLTRLMFGDLGKADSFGTFLDDVRLTLIDCPSKDSDISENNNTESSSGGSGIFVINNKEEDEDVWVLGFDSDDYDMLSICEQEAFDISSIVTKPKNSVRDEALFNKVYKSDLGVNDTRSARLAYFISSDASCTRHLGAGERAGVVDSFQSAYGRMPLTFEDWSDVIRMANGNWTHLKNKKIEEKAKYLFESVYLRKADMNNQYDVNALMVIAYGLRPQPRDLSKEKKAICIFIDIFHYQPTSAMDWSTMRAIAYSGAER